jgi:hypothetical protein
MDIKEFIIRSIRNIEDRIEDISIKYAYDASSDYHIIEVEPESTRRGNNEYVEMESNLWEDFYSNFPHDNILISEKCPTNDMSNILYETSIRYKPNPKTKLNFIADNFKNLGYLSEGKSNLALAA